MGIEQIRVALENRNCGEFSQADVANWYSRKTTSILGKYGPGPKVRFHVGLFDGDMESADTVDEVRTRLHRSQDRLMETAVDIWGRGTLSGKVLDVGCGLGGGSIFLAEELGATVTSITIVPEHIPHVRRLATLAGVEQQIQPILSDACSFQSPERYDAVMAIESSCYLPRDEWFQRLASLVRPGGIVCIEDSFSADPKWGSMFDEYWKTKVGTVDEYEQAGKLSGFKLDRNVDITIPVVEFWKQSNRWNEILLSEPAGLPEAEIERLKRSVTWHKYCQQAWSERGIETNILRFTRR